MRRLLISLGLLVCVLMCPDFVRADIITPAGLTPGQQFRLAFVSSQMRDATSSNIADYDQFIQNLAGAAGLGVYAGNPVSWQVIGSTATVDANDVGRLPATETIPIYLLTGPPLVDGGAADLWDGPGTMRIDRPFNVDEFGATVAPALVWTGTNPQGFAYFDGVTFAPLGTVAPIVGRTDTPANPWVTFGQPSFATTQHRLFGVSEVLTVPSAVAAPEPGSLTLLLMSMSAMAAAAWGRRQIKG